MYLLFTFIGKAKRKSAKRRVFYKDIIQSSIKDHNQVFIYILNPTSDIDNIALQRNFCNVTSLRI